MNNLINKIISELRKEATKVLYVNGDERARNILDLTFKFRHQSDEDVVLLLNEVLQDDSDS